MSNLIKSLSKKFGLKKATSIANIIETKDEKPEDKMEEKPKVDYQKEYELLKKQVELKDIEINNLSGAQFISDEVEKINNQNNVEKLNEDVSLEEAMEILEKL